MVTFRSEGGYNWSLGGDTIESDTNVAEVRANYPISLPSGHKRNLQNEQHIIDSKHETPICKFYSFPLRNIASSTFWNLAIMRWSSIGSLE